MIIQAGSEIQKKRLRISPVNPTTIKRVQRTGNHKLEDTHLVSEE
jgi:hypothetical protein